MTRKSLMEGMKSRPFAYADIYRHPPMAGPNLPPALAALRKNESGSVVLLPDGRWFVTWSQGSFESALDERIVGAVSEDLGRTWSEPRMITASTVGFRRAYGCPFVVPATGRIYLFLHEGRQHGGGLDRSSPEVDAGTLGFTFSDDTGRTWSEIRRIPVFERDISVFPGRIHGHLNHPPQVMPGGRVVLPFTQGHRNGATRRAWQLCWSESSFLECENLLTERDPARLHFSLLPPGTHGLRADLLRHGDNPAARQLAMRWREAALRSA